MGTELKDAFRYSWGQSRPKPRASRTQGQQGPQVARADVHRGSKRPQGMHGECAGLWSRAGSRWPPSPHPGSWLWLPLQLGGLSDLMAVSQGDSSPCRHPRPELAQLGSYVWKSRGPSRTDYSYDLKRCDLGFTLERQEQGYSYRLVSRNLTSGFCLLWGRGYCAQKRGGRAGGCLNCSGDIRSCGRWTPGVASPWPWEPICQNSSPVFDSLCAWGCLFTNLPIRDLLFPQGEGALDGGSLRVPVYKRTSSMEN